MLDINSNIPPDQFGKHIESLLLKAIDDSLVEFDCPACQKKIKVKYKDVRKSKRVVCRNCGQGIKLQHSEE